MRDFRALLEKHPLEIATVSMRYVNEDTLKYLSGSFELSFDEMVEFYLQELDAGVKIPPLCLRGGSKD